MLKKYEKFSKLKFILPALLALSLMALGASCQSTQSCECATEIAQKHVRVVENAKTVFITAMPEEAEFVRKHYNMKPLGDNLYKSNNGVFLAITGIGGKNVNEALSRIDFRGNPRIINVGYCGSNAHKIGEVLRVGNIAKIESHKDTIEISDSPVACRTADFFVENSGINYPCLFEMELFYIHQKFPNVIAYKIVSDNLSKEQFNGFAAQKAWDNFFNLIEKQSD